MRYHFWLMILASAVDFVCLAKEEQPWLSGMYLMIITAYWGD